jgi:hypothetical protein
MEPTQPQRCGRPKGWSANCTRDPNGRLSFADRPQPWVSPQGDSCVCMSKPISVRDADYLGAVAGQLN